MPVKVLVLQRYHRTSIVKAIDISLGGNDNGKKELENKCWGHDPCSHR